MYRERSKERKPNRLERYDYSRPGYYFVTICVKDMARCFGEVVDGKMKLNGFGEIVVDQWLWLKNRYPYIDIDEYIVMPNHVHGIVIIKPVGTGRDCMNKHDFRNNAVGTGRDLSLQKIKPLSGIIGAFKTRSSKYIHKYGNYHFRWQRSFYDRIIRNEAELNKLRRYVKNNPLKWHLDRNN